MYRKEGKNSFTGFLVIYEDGKKIYEKENFYSRKLKRKCATNWLEVDKTKIKTLQLYWKGILKAEINKSPSEMHKNELSPEDWYFSQEGYLDLITGKIKVICRNIGFREDNKIYLISVQEDTGCVIFKTKDKIL